MASSQDLAGRATLILALYPPGTFFQISPDGKLEQGGTVAMAKERDQRIAYYTDMITRNANAAKEITPVQAKDHGCKISG